MDCSRLITNFLPVSRACESALPVAVACWGSQRVARHLYYANASTLSLDAHDIVFSEDINFVQDVPGTLVFLNMTRVRKLNVKRRTISQTKR